MRTRRKCLEDRIDKRCNARLSWPCVQGTQLIESLSAIDGTAVEKVEAFTNLLVTESYVQFASISVLSDDDQMFMVLTAAGAGSDFLPKHYLLNVASSNWSVQRVVVEGTACFWGAADHNANELPEDSKCLYRMQKLRSFLAVPIKVGPQMVGVLNVGLLTEVDEQKHWCVRPAATRTLDTVDPCLASSCGGLSTPTALLSGDNRAHARARAAQRTARHVRKLSRAIARPLPRSRERVQVGAAAAAAGGCARAALPRRAAAVQGQLAAADHKAGDRRTAQHGDPEGEAGKLEHGMSRCR